MLDGSLVGMLVLYGATATVSTAATVVYHAIALWIPAAWGTLAFLILRRSRGRPLQLRPTRAERRELRGVASASDATGRGSGEGRAGLRGSGLHVAPGEMVVDQTHRLHERVHGGRPDEPPPPALEVLGHADRLG